MIDVVGAEAGAHQLLEQIRFLVRTLGRAETGERLGALLVADLDQALSCDVERLLPGSFAEVRERIGRIDLIVGILLSVRQPHQRLGQAMRMMDVVETEAALDAEAVVIGRAVAAFGIDHLFVLDLIGDLTADAAERAKRIDLPVGIRDAGLFLIQHYRGHQRAGRAGLHAFAAGDAGRFTHRIVEVENDLVTVIAIGHPDHVIDLDLSARALAQPALNAGIEVDAHRRMAGVTGPALGGGETAFGHLDLFGPVPEFRIGIVRCFARRLIGNQKLHHHFLRGDRARARRFHLHADARGALAGGRQHALALDLDHAGAAVAVRAIVWFRRMAKMGDFAALALCDLPDGFAVDGLDLFTIEFELDLCHSAASFGRNSSGKYLMTLVSGLEAAWPSPQIEASRITWLNSSSRSRFQIGFCINTAAFWVPTRQGVHWPQLSSSKKRIKFSAAFLTLSWSDKMITAAEPMKQPYFSNVPKSSGISSIDAGRMPRDAPPGK